MALGPGKYDDLTTEVREKAHADGVILIVIGGDMDVGFSIQADLRTTLTLPAMLRDIATQMEADIRSAEFFKSAEPERTMNYESKDKKN